MGAYSFLSVQGSLIGPGLNAQIGSTSGAAKEGLSTEWDEDKTVITTGADGSIMTTLRASMTGRCVARFLKTSPMNAVLMQAFNFQRASAANWGQNNITITDSARGDVVTGVQMSFIKGPNNAWSEEGNILEWSFVGIVTEILGVGTPDLANP